MATQPVERPHRAVNNVTVPKTARDALSSLKLTLSTALLADKLYDHHVAEHSAEHYGVDAKGTEMHEQAYAALHESLNCLMTGPATDLEQREVQNLANRICRFLLSETAAEQAVEHRAIITALGSLALLLSTPALPDPGDKPTPTEMVVSVGQLFGDLARFHLRTS